MTSSISTPNNTLYVANIDWKIKKQLLKRALYALFTRHGKVLEVVVLRRDGLRGQAWVIFDDVQAATAALQSEQGFTFFGKDLKLAFARQSSDRISKRNGTYIPKAKRTGKTTASDAAQESSGASDPSPGVSDSAEAPLKSSSEPQAPPSHILFAQDLPVECNEMMLAMLFRQYAGFKEVRIPRQGLAFIEFEDEPRATLALERLNGFNLTTADKLRLTYGRA